MRDYETVKVEQEVPNEFLLVLHEGEEPRSLEDLMTSGDHSRGPPKEKAAYYKNIERKMTLKKKRANVRLPFTLFRLFSHMLIRNRRTTSNTTTSGTSYA